MKMRMDMLSYDLLLHNFMKAMQKNKIEEFNENHREEM